MDRIDTILQWLEMRFKTRVLSVEVPIAYAEFRVLFDGLSELRTRIDTAEVETREVDRLFREALCAGKEHQSRALAAEAQNAKLVEALENLLPATLCGESWNLPDSEKVPIVVRFGSLKLARTTLAEISAAKGNG